MAKLNISEKSEGTYSRHAGGGMARPFTNPLMQGKGLRIDMHLCCVNKKNEKETGLICLKAQLNKVVL